MNRFSVVALSTLLISTIGCSKEDDLDARTVAEVVTHALGAADVLATHSAMALLAPDQASSNVIGDNIAALQTHLDAISEGSALVSAITLDGQEHIAVSLDGFDLANTTCTGTLVVNAAEHCAADDSGYKVGDWCFVLTQASANAADSAPMKCGPKTIKGSLVAPRSAEAESDFISVDGEYAALVFDFLGLSSFAAANASGDVAVDSQFRFVDSALGLWKGEAMGLSLQYFNDKPRGGTMILQAPNGQIYATGWEPVGQRATLVTVSWKSQTWTGCVENAGSSECAAAQTP